MRLCFGAVVAYMNHATVGRRCLDLVGWERCLATFRPGRRVIVERSIAENHMRRTVIAIDGLVVGRWERCLATFTSGRREIAERSSSRNMIRSRNMMANHRWILVGGKRFHETFRSRRRVIAERSTVRNMIGAGTWLQMVA